MKQQMCVGALVLSVACCDIAYAADERYGIKYFSGHAGEPKEFDGQMIFTDNALVFQKTVFNWRGRPVGVTPAFSVPYGTMDSVIDDIVRRAFLIIHTETAAIAEDIRIQVDKKVAQAVLTRLKFEIKKAKK